MTFRSKVPRETIMERAERQYRERMAFYQHLSNRTQAARNLISKETQISKETKTKET